MNQRTRLFPFSIIGDIIFGYPGIIPQPTTSPINIFIHGNGANPVIPHKNIDNIVPMRKRFRRTGIRSSGRHKQQFVQI